ncbi:phosphate transporter [Lipomyces orientalis]|uniref:Phosphate transporter n=1 Tax=Lipomyces orientalis TaxID=1233043 RepID=A0ACC3TDS4_9ASCO
MHNLDWLFAIGVLAFVISVTALGANDVANSYATSVSSRSLKLWQAGILAIITEFIGSIALGQRVTTTIRSGVFSIKPFNNSPGVLLLAMVIAEIGSGAWLVVCTRMGFPVSTTQSIVGALVGVGIAADIPVKWGWTSGSVSQIAASWGIAPLIAAGFGAVIMLSIRVLVHSRPDPLKAALRVIPFYYALTAGVLALFVVISGGHGIPTLEKMGAGKAVGIILGVFFGCMALAAVFFLPYFYRKLVKEDRRLRFWHVPMGPLLWRDNYTLYFPGNPESELVPNYYASELNVEHDSELYELSKHADTVEPETKEPIEETEPTERDAVEHQDRQRQSDLEAVDRLSWAHPTRLFAAAKFVFAYGVTRDVVAHQSKGLDGVHKRAPVFDNKVEYLWTTAQICSAMIMSIAHGANDVSNAIGPFTTEYITWHTGVTDATSDTPTWIKAIGGLGIGIGFWIYGYHIMRSLGNRVTKHTPTRGYSMELAAAITVLLASRLGLPVSTTQCISGAIIGVAVTNGDLRSINWKQVFKIFVGWVLTVPCAGLVAGILMAISLNVPHWTVVQP